MLCLLSFIVVTMLLVLSVVRLSFKEDISDFLPLDSRHQHALKVYQDISGANQMYALFQYRDTTQADPDVMVAAIDAFTTTLEERDTTGMVRDVVSQVDISKVQEITAFVYEHIPYFLTAEDYQRMDSLLQQPDYVAAQLQQDKEMLMFPAGGLLIENMQRDPLNLFTPVVAQLQRSSGEQRFEQYDGYIFSPDMQRAVVMMRTPFGASETENNSRMVALLDDVKASVEAASPQVEVHLTGGPVIAVGNASQIKKDSLLSVTLAILLILTLLFLSFRHVRNLLLIVVSIGWGWLFAIGGLSLVHHDVSIIVIGISSVILGIAVNYPLHLIAHLSHTPDMKSALKEIVAPLVVGNITTVGAFLALVPLKSVALRDLGLFSSFLLVGTILFVLLYLPHLAKRPNHQGETFLARIGDVKLEDKRWVVRTVILLTLFLGYFSMNTSFDSNMNHINYMTEEQKADMAYFQQLMTGTAATQKVYVVSTGVTADAALDQSLRIQPQLQALTESGLVDDVAGCTRFLCSKDMQRQRLDRWNEWIGRYRETLTGTLRTEARKAGFTADSFEAFETIVSGEYQPQALAYFDTLTSGLFASNVSMDSLANDYSVVDVLTLHPGVEPSKMDARMEALGDDSYAFDIQRMNSAIANSLSDDFNYIGWACGFIVFFFLWFSLGSIELAMLSFLPMAVSWIWILGLMGLLGIQFNIVNVILATFIFGQGDDYTIFMTEGASYEYAYRRKMLASYKHSIILSALIMFIGIGTLIVARHPALRSLAEVTIVGMFSVVLMAYIFPPLIFKWLVRLNGRYRQRPLSLKPALSMFISATVFFSQTLFCTLIGFVLFEVLKPTPARKDFFRRLMMHLFRFDFNHIPGVKFHSNRSLDDLLDRPAMIVCNHQSMIDPAIFMSLSPRLILVANEHPGSYWVVKSIYRWLGHVTLTGDNLDVEVFRRYIQEGYSLVVFPEGERNPDSSILRFHKGAFYLAEQLGLDIIPVLLHGANVVLPRNSFVVYPNTLTVEIGERVKLSDTAFGEGYLARTKRFHHYYIEQYGQLKHRLETADYFAALVTDRFRYKGVEVARTVERNLRKHHNYTAQVDVPATADKVTLANEGLGEMALLYALVHPDVEVTVVEPDEDKAALLRYSTEGVAPNLKIKTN